ncbi:flavin reductase family protein [Kocuria rhizophila]|uniref:flavin reductase family protein n=1 Tax=Kocuria rhizophila TaxID=72000 RepID=UPI000A9DA25C|nr:flavin reductase family protein [Kocuria rhizophila]WTI32109.1 flavin reductase family protein [Kocuria rhizophila]
MPDRVSQNTSVDPETPDSAQGLDGVPASGGEAERVAAHAVDLVAPTEALHSDPRLTEGFKSAFGQHPAGIAIITVAGPEGPVGLTASSVSSISADPPILGFSLQAKRGSAAVVATADSFVVHFLDSDNVELARSFAISGAPRFGDDMEWTTLPTGEPRLLGVRRVLRAIPLARIKAGSALVFNAAVVEVLGEEGSGSPLVYHQRQFHGLSDSSVLDLHL